MNKESIDAAKELSDAKIGEMNFLQHLVVAAVQGLCANGHVSTFQVPELAIDVAMNTVLLMAKMGVESRKRQGEGDNK